MDIIWYVVLFSLIGGMFSLVGGILLLSNKKSAEGLARYATPFAAGALLAAVFLDLLKEGVEMAYSENVLIWALIGILLFFYAERFLRWFHHHHEHDKDEKSAAQSLIIVGDTAHNLLDGVAIGAAFLISIPTGIITSLAVAFHEIPQEIGDFGLLLSKGMRKKKILLFNLLSAFATTIAAYMTFSYGVGFQLSLETSKFPGGLLGLSAGFLLYIAMSDIIPSIHESASRKRLFTIQPLLLLAGVLVVGASIQLAHKYIDTGHNETSSNIVEEH